MWTKVRNNSRYPLDEPQEHNLTQIRSPVFSWLPFSSERNGSITANPPAHDGNPAERTSGIIPGAIAGAVFIGFLLALYAVLWKCMVTQPKRRKRRSIKGREQRSLRC
nr:uncharacterized protein sb:cb288 [Misgurnus anguillicaudatus]